MFWIRTICCLAIVFMHAISEVKIRNPHMLLEESLIFKGLSMLQVLLMFATPTFIMISEFIISKAYPNELPKNFIRKRIKPLLLPYLFMSVLYSIITIDDFTINKTFNSIIYGVFLGGTTVYFIIIIFQFYILHYLFHKYLKKWKPLNVLVITFIINISYLLIFNLTNIPNSDFAKYIWVRGYYLPFIAWIFYFALGYYTGRYRTELKELIKKNIYLLIILYIITVMVVIVNRYLGILGISSKVFDIVPYTGIIFIIFIYLFSLTKKVPKIVFTLSNYSFSIYLLHKFYLHIIPDIIIESYFVNIIYLFLVSLILSVITSYIINKFQFGKYVVGTVRSFGK